MHLSSSDMPKPMYMPAAARNGSTATGNGTGNGYGHGHTDDKPLNSEALTDTHLHDVGLHPESYYDSRLPFYAAFMRRQLLPLVKLELPLLEKIQQFHSHWLTMYFLLTANVGSHTFYVIMLPMGVWLGSLNFTRDLVLVLGLGIYLTGAVKDLLCLPRPHSPPLERLTMSHYTAKEYGCPSSHSANATSVCIILFLHIYNNDFFSAPVKQSLYVSLVVYWITLVVGRLYCGMHGLVDVVTGALVGIATVLLRMATKNFWDYTLLSNNDTLLTKISPLLLVGFYYSLIYFHPTPVEPCPCFEDSIAFIAVLLGKDLADNSMRPIESAESLSLTLMDIYQTHPAKHDYEWARSGIILTLMRVIVGVTLVMIWKAIAKPLFTFLIRKLRNEPTVKTTTPEPPFAFISRTDTKIFVKFIVYTGIPTVAVYSMYAFRFLGL